jgi:hypothetical protein
MNTMPITGYKVVWPDGEESDPFDSEALEECVRRGYLQPEMMVYDPTVEQWMPASQIKVLAAVYNPPTGATTASARIGSTPSQPSTAPYSGPLLTEARTPALWLSRLPRKMYVPAAAALVLIVILIGIAWPRKAVPNLTPAQTAKSADGLYCVSVPLPWTRWIGPDKRLVEYTSPKSGVMMAKVWHVPANEAEFEHVTAAEEKQTKVALHSLGRIGDVQLTAIGGYPSQQFEMNDGAHPNQHRYQVTLIQTPDGIYTVTLFTGISSMAAERGTLNAILASFRKAGDNPASLPLNP